MKKYISLILVGAMAASLAACSSSKADATAETATGESATSETSSSNVGYDMGLDETGYSRGIKASDYIDMPEDWKTYTVDSDVYTVTDDSVQSELNYFASSYGLTQEVTGRAVENGDIVNIDYAGTVDGVAFTGGTTTGADLEIGSNSFVDDFEDQIVGHNVGDNFDVTVTFPEDYSSSTDLETGETEIELANKEAVFNVTLNSISVYNVTDDDVAENLGTYKLQDGTAVTTVDLFKQYITENYRLNQVSENVRQYFNDGVTAKKDLSDLVNMNLEANREYVVNQAETYGMEADEFVSNYSSYSTLDEYIDSMKDSAEESVKLALAVQYLAEDYGYVPTEDDIREYVGEDNYDSAVEDYGIESLAQECLSNTIIERYCNEIVERSMA